MRIPHTVSRHSDAGMLCAGHRRPCPPEASDGGPSLFNALQEFDRPDRIFWTNILFDTKPNLLYGNPVKTIPIETSFAHTAHMSAHQA
jgi:hypothetical protein